jgi:hypothetical protein
MPNYAQKILDSDTPARVKADMIKKVRKGDLIIYSGHVALVHSDSLRLLCDDQANCSYDIIHAYGANGFNDKNNIYHFMRKVVKMPNQIIYGGNKKLMPEPAGFGRIKLWD